MLTVNLGDWTPTEAFDWAAFFATPPDVELPSVEGVPPPTDEQMQAVITEPDDLGQLTRDDQAVTLQDDPTATFDGTMVAVDDVQTDDAPIAPITTSYTVDSIIVL